MADVANVISGPATLFVAPDGTAIPTLTGAATDFAAFSQPGYTDKGIEFDYSSTNKEIDVDELTSPVDVLITQEKLTVTVTLAESTLQNLFYSISGGTLTTASRLDIGGKVRPTRFVLGIMGPAPTTLATRQIIIYRAIPNGTVKMHYQRKDKLMYAASFQALGLSTLPLGQNMCVIQDF